MTDIDLICLLIKVPSTLLMFNSLLQRLTEVKEMLYLMVYYKGYSRNKSKTFIVQLGDYSYYSIVYCILFVGSTGLNSEPCTC
jgi:hypothetical protein